MRVHGYVSVGPLLFQDGRIFLASKRTRRSGDASVRFFHRVPCRFRLWYRGPCVVRGVRPPRRLGLGCGVREAHICAFILMWFVFFLVWWTSGRRPLDRSSTHGCIAIIVCGLPSWLFGVHRYRNRVSRWSFSLLVVSVVGYSSLVAFFRFVSLYLYPGTGSLTPSPFIDPRAFALSEAPSSPPPLLLLEVRHPSRLACRGPVHSTREAWRARPPVPPRRAERTEVIRRGLWFGEPRGH